MMNNLKPFFSFFKTENENEKIEENLEKNDEKIKEKIEKDKENLEEELREMEKYEHQIKHYGIVIEEIKVNFVKNLTIIEFCN